METLAGVLKLRREELRLTLREAEEGSGLSNAYLSQLENGKIGRPSPSVLGKLGELYHLSYARLMELAGYPVLDTEGPKKIRFGRLSHSEQLSMQEEKELLEYLRFIRSRRSTK